MNSTLNTKLFREVYKVHWTIENFHMLPFKDSHPVCSHCFYLGEHLDSAWSLLMNKQMHEGEANVGFKLIRSEDDSSWNNVTVSLSVIMEDGRHVNCIDKVVLRGESQNEYIFLIRPSKSKPAIKCIRGQEATYNCKDDTSTVSETKTISLSSKIENIGSVDGSTVLRNASCNFEDAESKKCNEQEDTVTKPDAESASPTVENDPRLKTIPKIVSCRNDDFGVKMGGEAQEDGAELKPEELLRQKDLTVVCTVDYTCVISTNLEQPTTTDGSGVLHVLKHLHDTGDFSDVTLKCKYVHFPCHKAVLGPISSVFNQVLQSKCHPTPVTVNLHMSLHIAKAFIMYMYKRKLPDGLSYDDYRELREIANHFSVRGMKRRCLGFVRGLEYLGLSSSTEEEREDTCTQSFYSIAS